MQQEKEKESYIKNGFICLLSCEAAQTDKSVFYIRFTQQ